MDDLIRGHEVESLARQCISSSIIVSNINITNIDEVLSLNKINRMSVCFCIQTNLANHLTDMVLLYSEVSYRFRKDSFLRESNFFLLREIITRCTIPQNNNKPLLYLKKLHLLVKWFVRYFATYIQTSSYFYIRISVLEQRICNIWWWGRWSTETSGLGRSKKLYCRKSGMIIAGNFSIFLFRMLSNVETFIGIYHIVLWTAFHGY